MRHKNSDSASTITCMNQISCRTQACILHGTLKSTIGRSAIVRRSRLSSTAGHRDMRKFGNAERPHNKALRVAGSLRMQLADIEIYWKTWSIPAAGDVCSVLR